MNVLKGFAFRLTSRKFLLALGAALTAFGTGHTIEGVVAVIGYLVSEGIIDMHSVSTAGVVEQRAHDLATQLLEELQQLPPAPVQPVGPNEPVVEIPPETRQASRPKGKRRS